MMDVRGPRRWVPGVWSHLEVMFCGLYMEDLQEAIRGLSGGLDVYSGIHTGLESSKYSLSSQAS